LAIVPLHHACLCLRHRDHSGRGAGPAHL
jgi:hypothetical protein